MSPFPCPNSQRRALPSGWLTSDADEIERRRLRGVNDQSGLNPKLRKMFFSVFIGSTPMQERPIMLRFARLRSQSIAATVPITALTAWAPASISRQRCTGFSTGASVLSAKQPARGSPYIEIFLDRRDHQTSIWLIMNRSARMWRRSNPTLAPAVMILTRPSA